MTTNYNIKYKRIMPGLYGTGLVSDQPRSDELDGEVELVIDQIERGYWIQREWHIETQTLGSWAGEGWSTLADAKAGTQRQWLAGQSDDGQPRVLAEPYTAKQCTECGEWIYVDQAPFAEGGDRTKPLRDLAHYEAHHPEKCDGWGIPWMTYNKEAVDALVEDVRVVAGHLVVMGVNAGVDQYGNCAVRGVAS